MQNRKLSTGWNLEISGRSTEVSGVLLNAGALNSNLYHKVDGLALAVHLLAKTCAALERRIAALEHHRTDEGRAIAPTGNEPGRWEDL